MKIDNYVIIASLNSETIVKLTNTIPGLCLLIFSVPSWAMIMHVQAFSKPCLLSVLRLWFCGKIHCLLLFPLFLGFLCLVIDVLCNDLCRFKFCNHPTVEVKAVVSLLCYSEVYVSAIVLCLFLTVPWVGL